MPQCAKCAAELEPDNSIHLWDGKDYCRDCVAAASPELLELAGETPSLVESFSADPKAIARREMRVMCIVWLFFVAVIGLAGAGQGVWHTLGMILYLSVIIFCVALPFRMYAKYRQAQSVHGSITVRDGEVWIRHPFRGSLFWNLGDCRWRIGKSYSARDFFHKLDIGRKIIILECPVKIPFFWQLYDRVPCGLTDDTERIWKAFFEFVGLKRV